jgi:nucleoside-diphosphate-sugar epimerase
LIEAGALHQVKLFINTDTFFGKKQFDLKYLGSYTSSKRVLESFLPGLCTQQLSIVNLRIEHVYGGNDGEQKFVPAIIRQALQNKEEILLTAGLQKRDFVYVKDVANAYLSVLTSPGVIGYKEFEVGTGQSATVKAYVSKIAEITGTKSLLNFGVLPTREGEITDSFADINPLKQLGWKPEYTIEQGLIETINSEKSISYDNAQ